MENLEIRDETIKLGQALKLHGVAEDGFMAKEMVQGGEVTVNGQVDTRRGATLRIGDVVSVAGVEFEISGRG